MSHYFWQTERIRLRGVEPDDWKVHFEWDRDSDMVRDLSNLHFPNNKARTQKWAEDASTKIPDGDNYHMQIELVETEALIGVISSHHTDTRNGIFKYGVAIHADYQRQGYASEAIILLMRYFFHELRYQKCESEVHGWNTNSIRLQETLGFTKEGQIRRSIYSRGQYHDRYLYGITIEEFNERYAQE
ncbi:MAG: GNAT family protein [Phototrophicaceae bacterium]